MRAIGIFTPMNAGESEVFGFDFTRDLPAGDTVLTVNFYLTVISGEDDAAQTRVDGVATVNGNIVLQRITGPLAGVVYALQARSVTTFHNTLVLWAPLACAPAPPDPLI